MSVISSTTIISDQAVDEVTAGLGRMALDLTEKAYVSIHRALLSIDEALECNVHMCHLPSVS